MIRIIGGEYKGRHLIVPKSTSVRPTSDRVRESMFNILSSRTDLAGKSVLDLFAGSGALGIEALSRGAAKVTFVDKSIDSLRVVKENLSNLGLSAQDRGQDVIKVIKSDALSFLAGSDEFFDVVFCDPPYQFDSWEKLIGLLNCTTAVLESNREILGALEIGVSKVFKYGISVVTILES